MTSITKEFYTTEYSVDIYTDLNSISNLVSAKNKWFYSCYDWMSYKPIELYEMGDIKFISFIWDTNEYEIIYKFCTINALGFIDIRFDLPFDQELIHFFTSHKLNNNEIN